MLCNSSSCFFLNLFWSSRIFASSILFSSAFSNSLSASNCSLNNFICTGCSIFADISNSWNSLSFSFVMDCKAFKLISFWICFSNSAFSWPNKSGLPIAPTGDLLEISCPCLEKSGLPKIAPVPICSTFSPLIRCLMVVGKCPCCDILFALSSSLCLCAWSRNPINSANLSSIPCSLLDASKAATPTPTIATLIAPNMPTIPSPAISPNVSLTCSRFSPKDARPFTTFSSAFESPVPSAAESLSSESWFSANELLRFSKDFFTVPKNFSSAINLWKLKTLSPIMDKVPVSVCASSSVVFPNFPLAPRFSSKTLAVSSAVVVAPCLKPSKAFNPLSLNKSDAAAPPANALCIWADAVAKSNPVRAAAFPVIVSSLERCSASCATTANEPAPCWISCKLNGTLAANFASSLNAFWPACAEPNRFLSLTWRPSISIPTWTTFLTCIAPNAPATAPPIRVILLEIVVIVEPISEKALFIFAEDDWVFCSDFFSAFSSWLMSPWIFTRISSTVVFAISQGIFPLNLVIHH